MSGLSVPTNKTPGEVLRHTPAPRPAIIGLSIVILMLAEIVFVTLVFWAISDGANDATAIDPEIQAAPMGFIFLNEQSLIAFWLACTFFCLSFIILLYQRYFTDHVTIAKYRYRKWEDEGVQLK